MSISYGGDTITDTSGGVFRPVSSVMRNRIINGGMVIDQRNAGAAVTGINAAGVYITDRWKSFAVKTWGGSGVVFTGQQNKGSVTPPAGFTNYVGMATTTANASLPSTATFDLTQAIEGYNIADLGWGTVNAKTVTLSFWAYSNLTGTFGGSLTNSDYNRCYVFSYTISAPNTWTYVTVTIAGDTSGTWLTTNGIGVNVSFSLGAGSAAVSAAGSWGSTVYGGVTGQQQVSASTSNYFYITGVQLEVGSSATGFEYRQYGQELALCQRYYIKMSNTNIFLNGYNLTSNYITNVIGLPVAMRSIPTATFTAGTLSNAYQESLIGTSTTILNWYIRVVSSGSAYSIGDLIFNASAEL